MWCIWCSARSPAPSCLPVLRSDCPRVATWRLSGGRRVILGGAAKTRGPVRQSLSGEFSWRQGCRSRTKCRMVHLLRWVTHTSTGESLALFLSVTVLHVFLWNGSPVSEGKRSLGVRVVVWRHAVDILSCRQTWSALSLSLSLPSGGGGGFARRPPLPATLCKVCFFSTQRQKCAYKHTTPPPLAWRRRGKKNKISFLRRNELFHYVTMHQTQEVFQHLLKCFLQVGQLLRGYLEVDLALWIFFFFSKPCDYWPRGRARCAKHDHSSNSHVAVKIPPPSDVPLRE